MMRGSIREYTEAVQGRYHRAMKKEKVRILDEFTRLVSCHRKTAIRLLRRGYRREEKKRRGQHRQWTLLWLRL